MGIDLPIPDEDAFETLTADLLTRVYQPPHPALRTGRRGQSQLGVDVYLLTSDGRHLGAQSKRYVLTKLTKVLLDEELRKAHGFEPALDAYVFVTAAPRDAVLSEHVRKMRIHGKHNVSIWFWGDVCDLCEKHGLFGTLAGRFSPKFLLEGLSFHGFVLPGFVTLDLNSTRPQAATSSLERETTDWIESGCADQAIAALTAPGIELTNPLLLNLLRAHMQRGDHNDVIALAEGQVLTPRQEAIVGLAHARLGDAVAARRCVVSASAAAGPQDRPSIVAMELSGLMALGQSDYVGMLASVPDALRDEAPIQGVLGDAAVAESRYEQAHAHYAAAEAAAGPRNWARRVAIAATRLAQRMGAMSSALLVVPEGPLREEIGEIATALAREAKPELDARSRRTLSHYRGLAAGLLGDVDAAVAHARAAVEAAPDDVVMWRRWLYVLAAFGRPLDREFAVAAPAADPTLQLMLSDLEDRDGDRQVGLARVTQLLASSHYDASADPATDARLHAHQILLSHPRGPLTYAQGDAILNLEQTCLQPAPGIVRLISHLNDPEISPLVDRFFSWLGTADLAGLDEEDQIGVAAIATEHGFGVRLERFVPLLQRHVTLPDGALDVPVAGVLAEILIARHRFDAAAALAQRWLDSPQRTVQALYLQARVLMERGELEDAYHAYRKWAPLTAAHAALMQNYVTVACALGNLRQARRDIRSWPLPSARSAADLQSLYATLAAIGDRGRIETLALQSLAPGSALEQSAGALFGITVRYLRPDREVRIRANCMVTIARPNGETFDYWVGDGPSPVQGAATAKWMLPHFGLEPGNHFAPNAGPFAGESLQLRAIRFPVGMLVEQAERLGRAAGTVKRVSGDTDTLVEDMRAQLLAQREDIDRRLDAVSNVPMPAVSMGVAMNASPRVFLRASGRWVPKCHSGTQEEIDAEAKIAANQARVVIDPATICLIVELELEWLIATFAVRPWVTAECERALLDWYMIERESVRAQGRMGVAPDGRRLQLDTYTSSHRKALRAYWLRVARFVRNDCERAPRAPDEISAAFAEWCPPFDRGTLSSIAVAKTHGAVLLSDELGVRASSRSRNIDAVSLRAPLDRARITGAISSVQAVRGFAALAETGRSFVPIPLATIAGVAHLPGPERGRTLRALVGNLKTAAALPLWPFAIRLLSLSRDLTRGDHRQGISPRKLKKLLMRAMPTMPQLETEALLKVLSDRAFMATVQWKGRRYRAAQRAALRRLARHLRRSLSKN